MGLDQALSAIDLACASGSVIRDPDVLIAYSHDASETAPQTPAAVVRVSSTTEVSAVLRAAHEHRVPVTPRGSGTGRVGGAVPVEGGIVLALDRMKSLKGIEPGDQLAVVEPGHVTGQLHDAVEEHGLFYPPDPNSLETCALGGNIAANAGGPRAFKYGVTREYVLGMEVVLADGTILQLGRRTKKGVTGYDLTALMIGSEGTLGVVTEATLRLIPKPQRIATLMVFLPDQNAVARAILAAQERRLVPRCLELLDAVTLNIARGAAGIDVPAGAQAMLLVELDGSEQELERAIEECGAAMDDAGALEILVATQGGERNRLWDVRRQLSWTLREQAGNKMSEDVVVPRTKMAALLARCRQLAEENAIVMPTYGHAGDGNLHVNFLWDTPDQKRGVDLAIRSLFESVIEMRGTLSGEHGIGVQKAPYLDIEQAPELIALQERIKDVFDPRGILNPGKIFPAGAKQFHGVC